MRNKTKLVTLIALLLCIVFATSAATYAKSPTLKVDSNTAGMTKQEATAYKKIIAMKKSYPEGKKWTNNNYRDWKGGYYCGGYGCAGFAFRMSDAAFGSKKAKKHKNFNKLRPGDVLCIDYGAHTVIVLKVVGKKILIAEGNYNRKIHWGRILSLSEIKRTGQYVFTRY